MAVTQVSIPNYLSLSKNPIEFHLRSTTYVTQQPTKGVYLLTFADKLNTLYTNLTLQWNGNTVALSVVANAGAVPTGYNLPDDITSTTLNQYVEGLVDDWLSVNYLLEKDFVIEYVSAAKIRFTAKRPGTELAITATTTIPSGEAVWSTSTSPIAWNLKDDYSIIMDVEVEEVYGSGEYTRVGTVHGDPVLYDDAGTWKGDVKIDVADLLHGFFQTRFDEPTLGSTTPTICPNTNLQWRAIYAERYTILGEVYIQRRVQTDVFRVLKGGLGYLDVPALADLETDFYGLTNKPFNTWQPSPKRVTQEEEHWLYYLATYNLTGLERFRLLATVYYTDGTSYTTPTGLVSVATQNEYETFKYNVGFLANGLEALQPTKTPYKYTMQIVVLPSVPHESVIHTFWLEESSRQDRYFLYENSLAGAWETLRCNGERQAQTEIDKTEAFRVVESGYAATDATIVQETNLDADSFEISTGLKPRAELIHLREFLRSSKCYEVVDGVKIPIKVSGGKHKLEHDKTGDYAYERTFNYEHAFINKGYSNA